ncbi:hypothetical protein GCM10023114_49140 [Mycolicibacterium sediminis]|uniref:Uncharacterized protein n=1 Tax=Mycolicibacterium sediminis TaxID=1286180 RepID=A0A7I7QM26_9MYCO|nr:hypothetical protein MSEDJ_14300 [Mycolicibacterium sediminis]
MAASLFTGSNRVPAASARGLDSSQPKARCWEALMDPNPDYDASDEIEYFFQFLPWGLRGVYPPPAYPPV